METFDACRVRRALFLPSFHPDDCAGLFVDLFPIVLGLALEARALPAGGVGLFALELLIALPSVEFERAVIE